MSKSKEQVEAPMRPAAPAVLGKSTAGVISVAIMPLEGTVRAMFMRKLTIAAMVLLIVVIVASAVGLIALRMRSHSNEVAEHGSSRSMESSSPEDGPGGGSASNDAIMVEVEALGSDSTIKGELDSMDETEVVVRTVNGLEKIPIKRVVSVVTTQKSKAIPKQYALAELTDGTYLYCESIDIRKGDAVLKLTNGAKIEVSLKLVRFVLREAHDPVVQAKWRPILAEKDRAHDSVIIPDRRGGNFVLNDIAGRIGVEDGGKLGFVQGRLGKPIPVAVKSFQALLFVNGPPKGAKPQIFRLKDVDGNVIPVAGIKMNGKDFTLTTVGGVNIEMPAVAMAKLDFAVGALHYLSEMDAKQSVSSNLVRDQKDAEILFGPVRDKVKSPTSNDMLPIRMNGVIYKHGLSVHAKTELMYDLDSEYEWFNATLGFSDDVEGPSVPIVIEICGDGKQLKTITLNRKDYTKPEELKIEIKDVDRLIIKVNSGGILDSGWVEFGDARVNK
jgi:hypothetical protein